MIALVKKQAIGIAVHIGALLFWLFIGIAIAAPVWMPFTMLALLLRQR